MNSLFRLFASAALLLPSLGWAGDTWDRVGPYGGWINDLTGDVSGRIVAGVSFGGIYRSSDGAESWQQIYTGTAKFDPRCVATNAAGHILVGSEGLDGIGFVRSTDDGATWQVVNNNLANRQVSDLLVAGNQHVYACTFDDGLFRSTDNGTTFNLVSSLPASFTTRIAAGPGAILYVGVQFESVNLYRSTDGGATWQAADSGIGSDVSEVHTNGSDVYAVAGLSVYKSANGGTTWTNLGAPSSSGYRSIAVDSNGALYASCYVDFDAGDTIYRSTNGGASWTQEMGLPGRALDHLLPTSAGSMLVAGKGPGVYRRLSGAGSIWEQKADGMVNLWVTAVAQDGAEGPVYAATRHSLVFRSFDAGLTWESAGAGMHHLEAINALAVNVDGTVFASGVTDGVYRSTNQGESWTSVHWAGATAVACNALGHVFAGYGGGMFRSTDNGATWTSSSLPGAQYVSAIAFDGTTVYAGTGHPSGFGSKGVYRSTDNGVTWATFNNGLTDLDVTSIAVSEPTGPLADETGCAVSLGTIGSGMFDLDFESLAAWSQNQSFTAGDVKQIRKRSYAETREEVAVTTDEMRRLEEQIACVWGSLASALAGDLAAIEVLLLPPRVDSAGGEERVAYLVGTVGYGILRQSGDSPSDVPVVAEARPLALAGGNPNPFHRTTVLEYMVTTRERVSLRIFDAAGSELGTLVDDWRDPGRYDVVWDAAGHASGVYFARLSTGSGEETRRLVLLR